MRNNIVLSKKEREYLKGDFIPSYAHKRVLDHTIRKKLKTLFHSELPLIKNTHVTDFTNGVTEFNNNTLQNSKVPEGVEPPCISFAGSRITVLPEYRLKKIK